MTSDDNRQNLIWGADEIAKELGRSRRQVFYMLEAGNLPAVKIGGLWCMRRADLLRLFDRDIPDVAAE